MTRDKRDAANSLYLVVYKLKCEKKGSVIANDVSHIHQVFLHRIKDIISLMHESLTFHL